jgi:hypothetical protein
MVAAKRPVAKAASIVWAGFSSLKAAASSQMTGLSLPRQVLTQPLTPWHLCASFGTTQEAAEKLTKFAKYPKTIPQRLKLRTHSMSLSGTDESVPFQNSGQY